MTILLRLFCGFFLLSGAAAWSAEPSPGDLDTLRQRMTSAMIRSANPERGGVILAAMRSDGTFPDVPYDNTEPGNWRAAAHLSHVHALAAWYASLGPAAPDRARLREAVFRSLDFWLEKDYRNSNWWWNEIGVPGRLSSIYLLLDRELEGLRRSKGLKIIARAQLRMTGANLVDLAAITIRRGVVEGDIALVSRAVGMIADEIKITTGEGIQPDFSFHQHGALLYNHGYGAVFLSNCTELAVLVANTAFAFPGEKIELISRMVLDGNQWMMRYGARDYGATGRGISRVSGNTPSAAYLAPIIRNLLETGTGRDSEFRNLLSRLEGDPSAPLVGNRHFWRGDYMAHHRPGFFASARMFSDRLFNTDGAHNQEGLKSHHLADGCTYIMRTGREYHDIFPVWDWRKIPGTTVALDSALTGRVNIKGTRAFAGGVSDGRYGCAAFDLERKGLNARKAWFFFDEAVVCLGAGIRDNSGGPVITTLNQSFLTGEVTVSRSGNPSRIERGSRVLDGVRWVHQDSTAYIFPEPARVHLENETRTGAWWDINHVHSKDPVSREVFTLWLDHGTTPADAGYAYIVAPGLGLRETERYAAASPVRILANERAVQAVQHRSAGITGAAFYSPGRLRVGDSLSVSLDRPCMLLVRESEDRLEITASNPVNTGMRLTVLVEENGASESVVFDFPDGDYAGMSVTRMLSRDR